VILAVQEGYLEAEALIPMVEVVRGLQVLDPGRTVVFKSTGMSWEDLVVAEEIMRRYRPGMGVQHPAP
jgi:ornithine cyclodeaminase